MPVVVYMATQKKQDIVPYEYIVPMHVGASACSNKLFCVTDDSGKHISGKNSIYSELTALYWIWKNSCENYVGLCHYRRFFEISEDGAIEALSRKSVIVPKIAILGRSMGRQYLQNHVRDTWEIMMRVLKVEHADYYETAAKIFSSNRMYPFNMFITKKSFVDAYCEWLFGILFEVEKNADTNAKNDYQIRYAGFLAERLFTLYIIHNRIDVQECSVINEKRNMVSQSNIRRVRNDVFYKLFGGKR